MTNDDLAELAILHEEYLATTQVSASWPDGNTNLFWMLARKLCSHVAELIADAQRYRTLRDSGAYVPGNLPSCPWGLATGNARASSGELNAAADAAIAASKEKP